MKAVASGPKIGLRISNTSGPWFQNNRRMSNFRCDS